MQENIMCSHGHAVVRTCDRHLFTRVLVGSPRLVPDPSFFGKQTYWGIRCCGKPMKKMKKMQVVRCDNCRVEEELVVDSYYAQCSCCGRQFHLSSGVE